MCRNEANIHEKSFPELNKKQCSKTEPQKYKNTSKMIPKGIQKNEGIFGEMPLGAALVVQTVFVIKNWPPALPKCAQERNMNKNNRNMNQTWLQKQPRE